MLVNHLKSIKLNYNNQTSIRIPIEYIRYLSINYDMRYHDEHNTQMAEQLSFGLIANNIQSIILINDLLYYQQYLSISSIELEYLTHDYFTYILNTLNQKIIQLSQNKILLFVNDPITE